jgi:hypothetical protein
MQSLLFGFLANRSSLHNVETMTEMGASARAPDSTLYDFVAQFGEPEVEQLRDQLHAQVKSEEREPCAGAGGLALRGGGG